MYAVGTRELWQLTLLKVSKGVMSAAYGVVFLAFIPLFVAFVLLLKRHSVAMYQRMKYKLYVYFAIFMTLLGIRIFFYNLI